MYRDFVESRLEVLKENCLAARDLQNKKSKWPKTIKNSSYVSRMNRYKSKIYATVVKLCDEVSCGLNFDESVRLAKACNTFIRIWGANSMRGKEMHRVKMNIDRAITDHKANFKHSPSYEVGASGL